MNLLLKVKFISSSVSIIDISRLLFMYIGGFSHLAVRLESQMEKYSTQIQNFLENRVEDSSLVAKSTGFISPGDVLYFTYPQKVGFGVSTKTAYKDSNHLVIVVHNKYGPGFFTSTRDNKLLSAIYIPDLTEQDVDFVVGALYKKGTEAKSNLEDVKERLGIQIPYKTYIVGKMEQVQELTLTIYEDEEGEEE